MIDTLTEPQFWTLMVAAAYIGFALGYMFGSGYRRHK